MLQLGERFEMKGRMLTVTPTAFECLPRIRAFVVEVARVGGTVTYAELHDRLDLFHAVSGWVGSSVVFPRTASDGVNPHRRCSLLVASRVRFAATSLETRRPSVACARTATHDVGDHVAVAHPRVAVPRSALPATHRPVPPACRQRRRLTGSARIDGTDLATLVGSLDRKAGTDLRYIHRAMGHELTTTTARIYGRLHDDEVDENAAALDPLRGPRSRAGFIT